MARMLIVAVDDTDSRERGMCTTYVGARLAERLAASGGRVRRRLLIRLNPAVKHKTRGNAAVALHVSGVDPDAAFDRAAETVREFAAVDDPRTSPGVVVADLGTAAATADRGDPDAEGVPDAPLPDGVAVPDDVAVFARRALRHRLALDDALDVADDHGYRHAAFGTGGETPETAVAGRGRIGALAAVGAAGAFDDWTVERISYRELDRCGTPRRVDAESVFAAADRGYPVVWDTVDRGTDEAVCVPNAPGPILHGIRGDDTEACREVAAAIESEPVERAATFLTNQGTDAHLADGAIGHLRDGAGYCVEGVVASDPETKRGGHVHVDVAAPGAVDGGGGGVDEPALDGGDADPTAWIRCVAFKPTGRFRDHVRALRPGDRVAVCGEHEVRPAAGDAGGVSEGGATATLKVEKFAVRDRRETERVVPTCPDCERSMSSAGRGQGYRCRDCGTDAPGKVAVAVDRELARGWYEVPPSARRHVAKPLVRGGFDGPTHPER